MLVCSLSNTSHELLLAWVSDRVSYSEQWENSTHKINRDFNYAIMGGKLLSPLHFTPSLMSELIYSSG